LRTFFLKLIEGVSVLDPINPALYPSIIDALMSGVNVKPKPRAYPRLHIWGLMEGRLQHADLMILGGLNEGVWPPEVNSNPWMSRPMMQKFGLSLPERRIGLTAHDFSQACAAKNVLLTRSTRINGSPMVPSRWLQKIENCLTTIENGYSFPTNYQYLNWFLQIDSPSSICPRPPPCPRPPLESRPKTLSVTSVETWIRDPYSIFAEKILLLKPLEPLDADPGATDKGLLIHKCLEIFIKRYPSGMLSEDAFQNLISIGNQVFEEVIAHPGIRAFWWPRFERIARWFVDFENNRRINNISPIAIEAKGSLNLFVDGVAFNLTARIDRIDCCPGGGIIIVDYKTGGLPSSKQVESGLSPQLLLEALIAGEGGVKGIVSKKVEKLEYIRLSGGLVPGEVRPLIFNLEKVASETLEGLHRLISKFNCLETPYLSRPRPQFKSRFGRYDHLARVKEWSHGSLGEDL